MTILAIETSTAHAGVALGTPDHGISSIHSSRARHHAELIAPGIKFLADTLDLGLKKVHAVGVDIGPGLFTGLRVGIASANALAFALGIPVIAISSLEALAFPARLDRRKIVTVMDARRGELYYGIYSGKDGILSELSGPIKTTPEQLAKELSDLKEDALLVGDGALRYQGLFLKVPGIQIGPSDFAFPKVSSVLFLAFLASETGQPGDRKSEAQPIYLRGADAQASSEGTPKY